MCCPLTFKICGIMLSGMADRNCTYGKILCRYGCNKIFLTQVDMGGTGQGKHGTTASPDGLLDMADGILV